MSELNLLPCPFCGSANIDPAEWSGNDGKHGKHGPGCGDCGALANTAELWNRRATQPASAPAEPKCRWPSCESEAKQQDIAAEVHAQLYGPAVGAPADELAAARQRIADLEECTNLAIEQMNAHCSDAERAENALKRLRDGLARWGWCAEFGALVAEVLHEGDNGGAQPGLLGGVKTAETRMDTGFGGGHLGGTQGQAGWKMMPPDADEAMMHAAEDVPAPRPYGAVYRAMFGAAPGHVVQGQAEPVAGEWTVEHSELARKILGFMGRSGTGSLEPGADPFADRLAEKLAGWLAAPAQPTQASWPADAQAEFADVMRQMREYLVTAPTQAVERDARVFTYKDQPGNVEAWRFGEAASNTARKPGGDYIDTGLQLLLELQNKGYGIVAIASITKETT